MKKRGNISWSPLIGSVFVSMVSILAALQAKNLILQLLLVLSAIVSLILAITHLSSAKKMIARIKDLEDNQLSAEYDDETLILKKEREKATNHNKPDPASAKK